MRAVCSQLVTSFVFLRDGAAHILRKQPTAQEKLRQTGGGWGVLVTAPKCTLFVSMRQGVTPVGKVSLC